MSAEPQPPPELAELLRGMRADALTQAEVARLAQRLGPLLGDGGGGGGAPPRPPVPRGAFAAAAGGAIVVAAAIAVWIASGTQPTPHGGEASAADAAAVAPTTTPRALDDEPPRAAPVAGDDVAGDDTDATALTIASSTEDATATPGGDIAAREESAPSDDAVAAPRPRSSEPRASEHTLLADARRALGTDPALALRLSERHRREFRDGALAPEREMITIDALSALGRAHDARRRAQALAARWPSSTYAERVRGRGLLE